MVLDDKSQQVVTWHQCITPKVTPEYQAKCLSVTYAACSTAGSGAIPLANTITCLPCRKPLDCEVSQSINVLVSPVRPEKYTGEPITNSVVIFHRLE